MYHRTIKIRFASSNLFACALMETPMRYNSSMGRNRGSHHFVVQKHKATTLHYDLRLESAGLMLSWSVPKGPTLDPLYKRLAMPTLDHALSYREFEGVIPEGHIGHGPVMIWDTGTFNPEIEIAKGQREEVFDFTMGEKVLKKEAEEGNIKFRLYGNKLQGSFALVRTRGFGGKVSWLLIKHKDAFIQPGFDANTDDVSAVSGKSLSLIEKEFRK